MKKDFILVPSLRVQSMMGAMALWQEDEVSGHIASVARK